MTSNRIPQMGLGRILLTKKKPHLWILNHICDIKHFQKTTSTFTKQNKFKSQEFKKKKFSYRKTKNMCIEKLRIRQS